MEQISTEKRSAAKRLVRLVFFAVSAFVGTLLFSQTTSPLYPDWGYDSAMFQTIGKYWAEGHLPYVELFDHKGPVIFFINAVGYAIGGRNGVFAMQVISLTAAECGAYFMLRERTGIKLSALAALALPLFLVVNWNEGNTTEEYILPFLFFSYALMLRWLRSAAGGDGEHSPLAAALYGFTFAFALLTRATNALGVCIGVLLIVLSLIAGRRWANLLRNALAFIIGAAVLILPFSVYFACHDALYDMWYGALLFNLDYYSASDNGFSGSLVRFLVIARMYLFGWGLVFTELWHYISGENRKIRDLFWLAVALPSTLFMYTLNDYAHYGIILLPFLYISFYELSEERLLPRFTKLNRILAAALAVVAVFSSALKIYRNCTEVLPPYAYERYDDEYYPLIDMLTEEDRESFVAWDCPRRIYLDTGIRPSFRYFTLQQWMCVNSDVFADNIRKSFEESDIRCVLVFRLFDEDEKPSVIREILDRDYIPAASTEKGVYTLYRHR